MPEPEPEPDPSPVADTAPDHSNAAAIWLGLVAVVEFILVFNGDPALLRVERMRMVPELFPGFDVPVGVLVIAVLLLLRVPFGRIGALLASTLGLAAGLGLLWVLGDVLLDGPVGLDGGPVPFRGLRLPTAPAWLAGVAAAELVRWFPPLLLLMTPGTRLAWGAARDPEHARFGAGNWAAVAVAVLVLSYLIAGMYTPLHP